MEITQVLMMKYEKHNICYPTKNIVEKHDLLGNFRDGSVCRIFVHSNDLYEHMNLNTHE